MNDLILYTTEDGRNQIKLRAKEQTVWLTQLEMAELFASSKRIQRGYRRHPGGTPPNRQVFCHS